jgi:hypothetical protein
LPPVSVFAHEMKMIHWLKEPLLHFLLLGALIFGFYIKLNPAGPSENEIIVTRGQQEHLVTVFSRTWNRPPTPQEFQGLVNDWIREEIAYRQGLEMGLDTNDTIIRRRLRQKLELLAEDIISLAPPTQDELEAYRAAHEADYTLEPRYTLRQVYFSPDRRGPEAARDDADQALVMLETGGNLVDPDQMGDPISLPQRVVAERASELDATFGRVFTAALKNIRPGEWAGPIPSGYGIHLVYIEDMQPGRPLTLEEAERDVRRDWEKARQSESIDRLYDRLAEQYDITIERFDDTGETGP